MKKIVTAVFLCAPLLAAAQDNLVKSLDKNSSDSSKSKFRFTEVIALANTSVKNQASSGTCWSYSTNSFLESEMDKAGKQPVELAQLFSARNVYAEKAESYIRMHGKLEWGDGGACHDVINMYAKYGAIPQSLYTGLHYGTSKNKFAEIQTVLKAMLDAWVSNPNGKLSPNWKEAFNAVLDSYLGKVPETFTWEGRKYTPQSFGKEVVGLDPKDYVELSSFTNKPYYKKMILMVPDNWSMDMIYNVAFNDITDIIDNALSKGYTVAWATDVSEKSFSWKNGVAYIPEKEYEDMSDEEKKEMFNGPQPERVVTAEMRQQAFDNYSTTDDHGMHIVGLAKDQNGREYYIVKNSWGTTNDYKGYLYVTKAFVRLKTTAFLLNKKAIPQALRTRMNLN
ncbi:C1 family peptidase [Taibaiella koreensis]|uniref:aminopeptidase C n=1 Tax=Taibaiella koreensis TaxID=1268548 RepID=UPI000E59D0C8|nr:C1 family peptidase [Taibaiella koreensis]